MLLLERDQGESQGAAAAELAAHLQLGRTSDDIGLLLLHPAGNLAEIARTDGILELHIIYTAINGKIVHEGVKHRNRATLRHNLAEDYSGNHRIAREMAAAEKLVVADPILAVTGAVGIHRRLVHKKHRLPVGDVLHYFFSVHFSNFLKARQALCPPKPSESEIPSETSHLRALLGV